MQVTAERSIGLSGRTGLTQGMHPARAAQAQADPARHFDKVTIQSGGSFQKELQSRISQEIRTSTTTGTVSALREQVQSGEYEINTLAIARRMLFVWGV